MSYGPADGVGIGTCYGIDTRVLFTFKIVSQERSGMRLLAREYRNRIALHDVEYCVSKDGCSMTKEYTFRSGNRVLSEYRRVDGDHSTQQLQHMIPVAPAGPRTLQQDSVSVWSPESPVPPPIEVRGVVCVDGKGQADVHIPDSPYHVGRLREGSFMTVGKSVNAWRWDTFVTPWKVTHIGPYELRLEGQGKNWVHRIGSAQWELSHDPARNSGDPTLSSRPKTR